MAISLKDNLDRVMVEMDDSLTEMELVYMSVDDTLVALAQLVNTFGVHPELVRGVKHVQQVYLTLVNEVRGIYVIFCGGINSSTSRFMVSVY